MAAKRSRQPVVHSSSPLAHTGGARLLASDGPREKRRGHDGTTQREQTPAHPRFPSVDSRSTALRTAPPWSKNNKKQTLLKRQIFLFFIFNLSSALASRSLTRECGYGCCGPGRPGSQARKESASCNPTLRIVVRGSNQAFRGILMRVAGVLRKHQDGGTMLHPFSSLLCATAPVVSPSSLPGNETTTSERTRPTLMRSGVVNALPNDWVQSDVSRIWERNALVSGRCR